MRNTFKLLSVLIAAVMLCSFGTPLSIFAEDKTEEPYFLEMDFLQTIGVLDNSLVKLAQEKTPMTRAQFIKLVARMLNLTVSNSGGEIFSDVSKTHPEFGWVNAAASYGIVKGSNGQFNPDRGVSYPEAITMVVNALGYDVKAQYMGGYPTGYFNIATDLALLKGVNLGSEVENEKLIRIAYHAMHAPYAKQDVFSSDQVSFVTDPNITLLSEFFQIYSNRGVAYDNGVTKLDGVTGINQGQISFMLNENKKVYTYNNPLGNQKVQLGYSYQYYFKEDRATEEKNLIFVDDEGRNKTLTLSSKNLLGYDKLTYHYEEDDKTKTAKLKSDNIIIYNEHAYLPLSNKDFIPAYGTVTLIDQNSDNVYDVVKINNVQTLCLDGISITTAFLKDKYNLNHIRLEENGREYRILKDGEEIDLEDLSKWNIISVIQGKNPENLITILVSEAFVEGRIEEIVDAKEVVIGGVKYGLAENLSTPEIFEAQIKNLKSDRKYVFYLDVFGNIAGIEGDVFARNEYIWIRNAAVNNSVDDTLQLKAYTINRKFESFSCAPKVTFNGTLMSDGAKMVEALSANGKVVNQLLRVARNSNGQINRIDTATYSNEIGQENFTFGDKVLNVAHKNSLKIFDGVFLANEQTVAFTIPKSQGDMDNEELYDCVLVGEMLETNYSEVTPYDIDENGIAGALMVPSGASINAIENHDLKSAIVDRIVEAIYKEGEIRKKIYYYEDNVLKSAFVSKFFTGKELNTGDVFRPLFDGVTGEISYYVHGFDFSNQENVLPESSSSSQSTSAATNYNGHTNRFVFGEVVKVAGSTIRVKVRRGTYDGTIFTPSSSVIHYFSLNRSSITVYQYQADGSHKIYRGTQADFLDALSGKASKVVMRQRYGTVFETYIYNEQ